MGRPAASAPFALRLPCALPRHACTAAAELQFVGTHTGEFAGVPASGRPVDVPYTAAYDFAPDGSITGIRVYLPMQIVMGQIGG